MVMEIVGEQDGQTLSPRRRWREQDAEHKEQN
jgi:hypothetical protein